MSGAFISFFALLAVVFAGLVLTQRQPMRAALALVGKMVSLAAVYACLGAHVVAVFQVLIYVGAVMVFMVYTIMLLDDKDRSCRTPFSRLWAPALPVALLIGAAIGLLTGRMTGGAEAIGAGADLFSFQAFSLAFMTQYWFHFELATVLLLIGILAAWTALREGRDG